VASWGAAVRVGGCPLLVWQQCGLGVWGQRPQESQEVSTLDLQRIAHVAQVGLRAGWTQEKVAKALALHLERERQYLARRKAQGQHTSYDDVTEADQVALALAIVWLLPSSP
jgi:hypothetical protein